MAFFYILYSSIKDRYYVGSTHHDVESRLYRHKIHHKGYTGQTDDWRVVYKEFYEEYSKALQREKEVKAWKSRKKNEEIIRTVG